MHENLFFLMLQTKKYNRQAAESEHPTLFALVESLQEPACIVKPDGQVLVINSLFALRFGKTTEECHATNIYDLVEKDVLLRQFAGTLKETSAASCENGKSMMFEDRDGGWNVTVNPVRAASGRIASLFVTLRGIPEQRMAGKKPHVWQDFQNELFEALPCSAIIFDADLQVVAWNRYANDVLFHDGNGCHFCEPSEFFRREEMHSLKQSCVMAQKSGQAQFCEIAVSAKGGSDRTWLMTSSQRIEVEGEPCVILVALDITRRKVLEEELRKSKAIMGQALKVLRAGVWEKDIKNNTLFWSDTMWELFGLDAGRERLSFELWKKVLHTDDRKVIEISELAIKAGTEMNTEFRICLPDGSIRWFTSRGMPERNGRDCVGRYIGAIIDITERKLLEKELVESKVRYRYALDAAQAGIWEWNVRTDEMSWSEQVWKLYGMTPGSQSPTHQLCFDTVHAEDRQMVSQRIKEGVGNLEAVAVEYRAIHPDGSVHWLTSRGMPIFDIDGKLARYIGTIIDITKRKQIELELLENKKRLGYALEAARAGVWEWNTETGENIWSDEIWSLYGLSREPGLVPSFDLWVDSVHPEDREMAIWVTTAASRQQMELNVEYRTIHQDGSVHWLMVRGKPKLDKEGKATGYIGTAIDITERKIVEIKLRESKFRFNFALEATGAGIWEWDVRADRLFWSDQIWKLYGLQPQGNISSRKLWSTNIHTEDHDTAFQAIMSASERQEDFTVEYRVCHNDGAVRWLMCRGVPLPSPDVHAIRYLGMVMDITERRRAEEERKKSQEQLNLVIEKGKIGVMTVDLKTSWVQRTHQYARIFGYDSLVGDWSLSAFLEHIVTEERQTIRQTIERCFETHESYSFECRIHTADNLLRWIWVFGTFSFDSSNGTPYLLNIVQDITDRKQAELFLKESEQKFRNIFELSPVAIGIVEVKDDRLFDVNAAFTGLLGFSRETVIGKKFSELELFLHQHDHDVIMHDLQKHGRVSNRQLALKNRSGKMITVLFSAERIIIAGQNGILMMMSDITVQELQQASINQLEKAVADRTERLREEVKRLHLFLSMISHEYRTPLAIIRGNLDLIDLKSRAGDYVHHREMSKIKQAIERLVEVMEVSIQDSRIQESPDQLIVTNFLAEPAILSQVEAFQSMWPERTVDYSGPINRSEIIGEPGQFKMAIFNLLDNARKYSPPDSPIKLECHNENGEVVITIRNEGKSISGDECSGLFEKYRRGSNAANTGGAGIGLWLVRDIIEHHHGKVTLSGTDTGVEAVISLPLAGQKV